MLIVLILFFCSCFSENDYDVIIIGGGLSGLSTASWLSQNGKKVVVIERMNVGGSLQTFQRVGKSGKTYDFEPGIHYIANYGLEIINQVAGKDLEMFQMSEIDYIFVNRTTDPYTLSMQPDLEEYFLSLYPSEGESITSYFIDLEKTTDPKVMMDDIIKTKIPVLRFLMKFMSGGQNIPVVIYQMFFNYYYESGACFPVGAANAIINSTRQVIESHGGVIISNCEATKLLFDDQNEKVVGVDTSSCGSFSSSIVVSSMNFENTFGSKSQFIDPTVLTKFGYTPTMLDFKAGGSSMLFFLGFNASNDILKFPVANMRYLSKLPVSSPEQNDIYTPSWFFATALSVRDPDYPKDRSSVFIMTDSDFSIWKKWESSVTHKRPADYYAYKQKYLDATVKFFLEFYPQAAEYLDVSIASSPLTMRDYLNHPGGEIYGGQKMDWFDFKTQIPGLYMTGQDIVGDGVYPNAMAGITVGKMLLS